MAIRASAIRLAPACCAVRVCSRFGFSLLFYMLTPDFTLDFQSISHTSLIEVFLLMRLNHHVRLGVTHLHACNMHHQSHSTLTALDLPAALAECSHENNLGHEVCSMSGDWLHLMLIEAAWDSNVII